MQAALDAIKGAGEDATRIGTVTATPGRTVTITAAGLTGKGDTFEPLRLSQAGTLGPWTSGTFSCQPPPVFRWCRATG